MLSAMGFNEMINYSILMNVTCVGLNEMKKISFLMNVASVRFE